MNTLSGYIFAKKEFYGKNFVFALLLATLMVPRAVTLIPAFLMINKLGLFNTYWAIIIPELSTAFGIFMMRQFISSLPSELIEVAKIDGAGELRTFWSIIIPLSTPAMAALGIFTVINAWNAFLWPLIVMIREDRYTLPVALASLNGQHPTEFGLLMAASVIVMAPVVLVFMASQKFVIRGIATTGIKE